MQNLCSYNKLCFHYVKQFLSFIFLGWNMIHACSWFCEIHTCTEHTAHQTGNDIPANGAIRQNVKSDELHTAWDITAAVAWELP